MDIHDIKYNDAVVNAMDKKIKNLEAALATANAEIERLSRPFTEEEIQGCVEWDVSWGEDVVDYARTTEAINALRLGGSK